MEQPKLSFTNRWMFNRVMLEEAICRQVIEAALGFEVGRIDYLNAEQAMEPDVESRGVRMDVYVRESGRSYDVEMQVRSAPFLGRRFRYYQSALDAHELPGGSDYDELPESFIIFICCSDPFQWGLPVYHVERTCREAPEVKVGDDAHWLALNARAWSDLDGGSLRDLLRYVKTGKAFGALAKEIDEAVERANEDRKWVEQVWSVSTIEEDDARTRRMEMRMVCAKALEKGLERGLEQGEDRFAALADKLFEAGRVDDLRRASADSAYRECLFEELNL